jgi:hypothetical protein
MFYYENDSMLVSFSEKYWNTYIYFIKCCLDCFKIAEVERKLVEVEMNSDWPQIYNSKSLVYGTHFLLEL